jgi:hypothetical protein
MQVFDLVILVISYKQGAQIAFYELNDLILQLVHPLVFAADKLAAITVDSFFRM